MDIEIKPCPKCDGKVDLYSSFGIGAIAICQKCREEFEICGMEELKIYNGCRIRASTVRKIKKMWNKQAESISKERGATE